MIWLELLACVVSLMAAKLVAEKIYHQGFICHCAGDAIWVLYGFLTRQYFLAIMAIIFFHLSLKGLKNHNG